MSCLLECKLQVRAFVLFVSVSAAPKAMPTTGVVLNKSLSNEWMHRLYIFTTEKYFSANICHYDFTFHFPAVILLTKQFTINRESIKKASRQFKLLECIELSLQQNAWNLNVKAIWLQLIYCFWIIEMVVFKWSHNSRRAPRWPIINYIITLHSVNGI